MSIDCRTTNSLWSSVLAVTLVRLGLEVAVICPGSRSTPLTLALVQQPEIETIAVLDERSAAFFALGLARRSGKPVVLVCTSGTAGANFYGAVIEAREGRVPLLLLTADRPPELRDCNAGQTVDQQKLYGSFPNWYSEVAIPSPELAMLAYLRQTVVHAWERCLWPGLGPVHLNLPFRDPLTPGGDAGETGEAIAPQFRDAEFVAEFFAAVAPTTAPSAPIIAATEVPAILPGWSEADPGLIVAGLAQPPDPHQYCEAIAHLARTLGWPVLAEALSPLRNYAALNPYLISTYDLVLRNPRLADKLAPTQVIRIGDMPTSKVLRQWLTATRPRQWVIDEGDRNLDPLHGQTTHVRRSPLQLAAALAGSRPDAGPAVGPYLTHWLKAEATARTILDHTLEETQHLFEGKAAWLLSQHLPPHTPLFIANSMPVRDMEWFWQPGDRAIRPWFNRGANGIDGTLSTALGVAHRQQPSVMLTGDLALLHDTNGLLLRRHFQGHLTIVLINNDGGGIFEMLPIANVEPPFEAFFATPQTIDFAQLCATYGIAYEQITTWDQLQQRLNPLPNHGIRVLELGTDRKADARWRKFQLDQLASCL